VLLLQLLVVRLAEDSYCRWQKDPALHHHHHHGHHLLLLLLLLLVWLRGHCPRSHHQPSCQYQKQCQ
jgi:hypothetical protein